MPVVELQVGDRVEYFADYVGIGLLIGDIGTIIEISDGNIVIEWDRLGLNPRGVSYVFDKVWVLGYSTELKPVLRLVRQQLGESEWKNEFEFA